MINIRKLEGELWESADLLRQGSKLTSSQYCMPVLALLFLRYAYSRYKLVEAEILKNRPSRGGRVMPVEQSDFAAKSALYLPREAQFDFLVNLPEDIASVGLKNKEVMAICSARRYFYVQTPYFLPNEEVMTALQTAALAGVDVRLMLPKRGDTWLIHKGSLSYLSEMMKAGVKIYLYKKGFLHSKLMVCDDELSTVGSTNMDFRSFEHNFEANAFFYDKETAMTLKEIFLADQKDCFLLSARIWEKRSWKNKITESVVRLLAPLL